MKRAILIALFAPAIAHANFAECLIKRLPGTANDLAAGAIHEVCQDLYPGGIYAVEQGSGRGFFGYKSGAECTADKAANTRSARAAWLLRMACMTLYDPPPPPARTIIDEFLDSAPNRR